MTAPLQIGRYELVQPIASGGMATVYLARSRGARGFERQVALKVMHPHLAEDPEFVAMFLDEARMAANIRHPNVVPTLDVVEEAGQLFLVMEYVEGHSLQALDRSMKKRRVPMPLDVALRIALDMLAGLHAAHELAMPDGSSMNLVHRDVSPHNVLVGVDGSARIMDFGIARAEIRINSTMGTSPKGKIPYMSPEQILSSGVDRRTDVYAAGIVLWEMLAGTGLFRADNEGALLHLVIAGTKRSPAEVRPEVPAPICAVCMRALAVSPKERFPTAAAFGEAIEQAAAEAKVTIASPRVVGALVKEVPPEKARAAGTGSSPGSAGSDPMRPSLPSIDVGSSAPVVTPLTPLEVADTPPAANDVSSALAAPQPSLPSAVSAGTGSAASTLPAEGTERAAGKKLPRAAVVAVATSIAAGGLIWLFVGGDSSTKSEGSPALTSSPSIASTTSSPSTTSATSPTPVATTSSASSSSPLAAPASPSSAAPVASGSSSGERAASAQPSAARASSATTKASPQGAPTKKPTSSTFRPEEP